MLVVVDGKTLMHVCELQYNRMKSRLFVEIVYRQTDTTVYTKSNTYKKEELKCPSST